MNHFTASLIVAACVFLAACIGLMVHRVQPESHRTKETLDVVRLGTGVVSVLASLVLGLLIATAESSSDHAQHRVDEIPVAIDRPIQVAPAAMDLEVGVSRPREFHPRPLVEPDVNLSAHPAPTIQPTTDTPSTSERTHPVDCSRAA